MSTRGVQQVLEDLQKALNGYRPDIKYCRSLINEVMESYNTSLADGFCVKFDEERYDNPWLSKNGSTTAYPQYFAGIQELVSTMNTVSTPHPGTNTYKVDALIKQSGERYLPPRFLGAKVIFPDQSSKDIKEFLASEAARFEAAGGTSWRGFGDQNILIKIPKKNNVLELANGEWKERPIVFEYFKYGTKVVTRTEYLVRPRPRWGSHVQPDPVWQRYQPYGNQNALDTRKVDEVVVDYNVKIPHDKKGNSIQQEDTKAA